MNENEDIPDLNTLANAEGNLATTPDNEAPPVDPVPQGDAPPVVPPVNQPVAQDAPEPDPRAYAAWAAQNGFVQVSQLPQFQQPQAPTAPVVPELTPYQVVMQEKENARATGMDVDSADAGLYFSDRLATLHREASDRAAVDRMSPFIEAQANMATQMAVPTVGARLQAAGLTDLDPAATQQLARQVMATPMPPNMNAQQRGEWQNQQLDMIATMRAGQIALGQRPAAAPVRVTAQKPQEAPSGAAPASAFAPNDRKAIAAEISRWPADSRIELFGTDQITDAVIRKYQQITETDERSA